MRLPIVILLAMASLASADDRADRETARKEFAAGQAADKRRDYAVAIEHYKKANELVPHPFAMFNIAVDYEKLGKLRDAATWYERYLDSSTTKDADREKVNRLLIELRNRPAQVEVLSNPDGGRVIIDGLPVGTTPYRGELKGGIHHVAVQKGDERDSKEITIEYGEPVVVQFAFRDATGARAGVPVKPASSTGTSAPTTEISRPARRGAQGTLVVRGEPYGALVSVDNVPIGTLPLAIPVEVGVHRVRITADGYATYEEDVSVTPNAKVPVEARLARSLGSLTPTGGKPGLRIGYLVGGGAGVDTRGNGALYMGEFGLRSTRYDLAARIGKIDDDGEANDVIVVDLFIRWALTDKWIAPFVGGGYSFVSNGYGYTLMGGVRVDLVDNDRGGLSLVAESGFRYYAGTSSGSGSTGEDTITGSIVPVMASLLLRYR